MGKKVVHFKNQHFHKLRRECRNKSILFRDPEFATNWSSLFYSRSPLSNIEWKRPGEIVDNPKLFLDGVSADDFSQGMLGNCWFVAACASISEDSRLWVKVVPDHENQEWKPENKYAGIFHFKFWKLGEWVDVVIDDFLPTRNRQLMFTHSKTRNEFWSALLEKAYAKLFGSYEALTGGKARDAMVDMTGGVGESISLNQYDTTESRQKLFDILYDAYENKALISASIMAKTDADMEMKTTVGLVKGHAYSITAVKKLTLGTNLISYFKREKIQMIRCRNPWGGVEWNGPWSANSEEWKNIRERSKKEMGLNFDENGEFWMAFEDFCRYYTDIDICHIMNTSLFSIKKKWKEYIGKGEWTSPSRCGGCGNYSDSFLHNPQYLFNVENAEELLVSLEQEDKRSAKRRGRVNDVIGFTVLRTDMNRKYRVHDKFYDKVHSGPFSNARSVFARVSLTKGRYCIIPSTYDPRILGKYILRMYSTNDIKLKAVEKDGPKPPGCLGPRFRAVTAVTVYRGEGILNGDQKEGDLYCIINCEGNKQRTSTVKETSEPEWKDRATFFRKKPEKDILIEVWDQNIIRDEFLGVVTVPMAASNWSHYQSEANIVRYNIVNKDKESRANAHGYLWLNIQHNEDLSSL